MTFLTLHILNLCTTLTSGSTQSSLADLRAAPPVTATRKVDITSPVVTSVFTALSASRPDSTVDLLVKITPPIYLRVVPPSVHASDMFDRFMSAWTSLVGDPVLSKWIVLVLAVSVALNGYLLKGIAAGLAAKGPLNVRFQSARPTERRTKIDAEPVVVEEKVEVVDNKWVAPAPPPVEHSMPTTIAPVPRPALVGVPSFMLDNLDMKLKAQQAADGNAGSSSSSEDASPTKETLSGVPVRSLLDCIDIYENGPRPVAVSCSLLTDEEIVLLAQNGKIAAYALEKVLGDLERAVRIRRSLICEYCFYLHRIYHS